MGLPHALVQMADPMRHPITEWERFWLLGGLRITDRVNAVVSQLARLVGLR